MYNANKHDIEEMAKGQTGLKWPPLYEITLHTYTVSHTSTKQIEHQKTKQTKHAPKLPK